MLANNSSFPTHKAFVKTLRIDWVKLKFRGSVEEEYCLSYDCCLLSYMERKDRILTIRSRYLTLHSGDETREKIQLLVLIVIYE
ncbi:hypothetical protein NPIL_65481 [Nephila pilipes]|uniref:Uncharacterized protein n=1 Tax=Nephila pilipes TaxID=299642 RepID=A0A8X6NRZ9_NEPPI|nr:hypothetical protein NPIL_65481 [Nephila pilipes]